MSKRFAEAALHHSKFTAELDARHTEHQSAHPQNLECALDPDLLAIRSSDKITSLGLLRERLSRFVRWVVSLGDDDIHNIIIPRQLRSIFDADWYLATYDDVRYSGMDGWEHFIEFGIAEGRNPNAFFDSRWYLENYRDVAASGLPAIVHFMLYGAQELRDPSARFDSRWYVRQNPDASPNPLLFHLRSGVERHLSTQPHASPSSAVGTLLRQKLREQPAISIIIPVYRGLEETLRCIESVLADTDRPANEVIVVDDCSPEPELSASLRALDETGAIRLIRNEKNCGFVASVNKGMAAAGSNDVVLLNSDTIVPNGWLKRLEFHARKDSQIGTVTPFSNNATICSYPDVFGGEMPHSYSVAELDDACSQANSGISIVIPTAVGFAMYITRNCIEDVGPFDQQTFGLGYGEENDFCLRAIARGWLNVLACDVFVYHKGEVSFGKNSPRREAAFKILTARYPDYARNVEEFVSRDPAARLRFAATAQLLTCRGKPAILLVTHVFGGGNRKTYSRDYF